MSTVKVDTISEYTSATGVTIDGVLCKDSAVTALKTITVIPGDGTISVAPGVIVLTKGSAAAIVLPAPTAAQAGTLITITNGSAFAHVITGTDLIHDGVTGGAKDKITLGAYIGASATLLAYNELWHVISLQVAPVTAN